MIYEATVAKKFFIFCAAGCLAVSVLGFFAAGIIPSASTANGEGSLLVGGLMIAAFWGMAAFFIVKARDTKPHLRIGPEGLWYGRYSDSTIPWDQFVSLRMTRLYNQRIVGLNLVDPEAYPRDTLFGTGTSALNRATTGDVTIAATNLSGGHAGVLAAIRHYRPDLFEETHRII